MGDRDRMQGPRDWYAGRDSERNNGKQSWREDRDRRERGYDSERRRDSPEQHGRMYERDEGRYRGQHDWYASRSSTFGEDEGGWQRRDERQHCERSREHDGARYNGDGGDRRMRPNAWYTGRGSGYSSRNGEGDVRREDGNDRRERYSSSAQYGLSHNPRPYGNPGNSQWREGNGGRHGNPMNVQPRYGTSVDRKVREEVEQATGAKERAERGPQHAEDEQHAELLRMQAAGEKERARRVREGEEARAAVVREQEQRQKLAHDVAVKMTSGVTIQDDEHFPKTRKEVGLLAYVCTRARTKDTKGEDGKMKEGTLLLPEGDHGDIFEHMLRFFTRAPDFISVNATYTKLRILMPIGDKIFGEVISSDVGVVVEFLNKKMKEGVQALPTNERIMMRLIENAKRKKVLTDLATRLVDGAKTAKLCAEKAERVVRVITAAEESPTLDNIFRAFDETTTKLDGGPLWSLSANIHSNLVSFNNNMTPKMKEKYPESKGAVKVLELARKSNYLKQLARYAANKKAEEDDDGPRDMSDM
jgi:hypothetical protein